MTRAWRHLLLAVATAVALACSAGSALAAPQVRVDALLAGAALKYEGPADSLTVSDQGFGKYDVVSTEAMSIGAGCQVVGGDAKHATCSDIRINRIEIATTIWDETITVNGSTPAAIAAGHGADTVRGGNGDDLICGDSPTDPFERDASGVPNGCRRPPFLIGGMSYVDTLEGRAGNDRLHSVVSCYEGNDNVSLGTVSGGPGNDVIGGSCDRGVGGPGADQFDSIAVLDYSDHIAGVSVTTDGVANDGAPGEGDNVGVEQDEVIGTPANDSMSAVGQAHRVRGVQFRGQAGQDHLVGSDDWDRLHGGEGSDLLDGRGGPDTLDGGADSDMLDGGAGGDTADYRGRTAPLTIHLDGQPNDGEAGESDDVRTEAVEAGSGNDTLVGSAGDDGLVAGAGNDTMRDGGGGADRLDGGGGTDFADYSTYTVGQHIALGRAGGNGDTVIAENLATGSGDDVLAGDGAPNQLSAGAGNDVLRGGGGDDLLLGSTGTDTASYSDRGAGVTVDLVAGTGVESGETDVLDVENVTGGGGNDRLLGNASSNALDGGPGQDVLDGRGGADVMTDSGTEPVGVKGPFDFFGEQKATDWVIYETRTSAVAVSLDGTANDGESGEGDSVGAGIDAVRGTAHDDTLTGAAGTQALEGGPGADTLDGASGDDLLQGGPDSDALSGGDGADWLNGGSEGDTLAGGAGTDTVDYSGHVFAGSSRVSCEPYGASPPCAFGATVTLDGTAGDGTPGYDSNALGDPPADSLAGDVENVRGSHGRDSITGNAGPNRIEAAWNTDLGARETIDGGAGADGLYQGTFWDEAARSACDTVPCEFVDSNAPSGNPFGPLDVMAQDDAVDTVLCNSAFGVPDGDTRVTANADDSVTGCNRVDRGGPALGDPPANDDFAAAELVAFEGNSGSVDGLTTDATGEDDEPSHADEAPPIGSVWYAWTPSANVRATVDLCTSDYDAVVAVYEGASLAELNGVASNDDTEGCGAVANRGSVVSFNATANTTYRIAVDGKGEESGTFTLHLSQTPIHATTTSLACSPATPIPGEPTMCTATVQDTAGTPSVPTGAVKFGGPPATLDAGSCSLEPAETPGSAHCSVTYTPADPGVHTLTADYGGDTEHSESAGTLDLAPVAPGTCGSLRAATWIGGAEASWTDGANWSSGREPDPCTVVWIRPNGGAASVTVDIPRLATVRALFANPGARLTGGALQVADLFYWRTHADSFNNHINADVVVAGPAHFVGDGNTFIDPGSLTLAGGGSFTGGYVDMREGGALVLDGTTVLGGGQRFAAGRLVNEGTTVVRAGEQAIFEALEFEQRGTLTLGSATSALELDGAVTHLRTGSSISGPGVVRETSTAGEIDIAGAPELAAGARLRLEAGVVTGQGTLDGVGSFEWVEGAIEGGPVFGPETAVSVSGVESKFIRDGAGIRVEGTSSWTGPVHFTDSAGLIENAGDMTLPPGSSIESSGDGALLHNFGTLRGAATLGANLRNDGTLAPGSSVGTLAITYDFTQGPAGVIAAEIAGTAPTAYDRVQVAGAATLGGSVQIVSLDGFAPALDDRFEIVTHASRTGTFSHIAGAVIDATKSYGLDHREESTTLVVEHGGAPSVAVADAQAVEGTASGGAVNFVVTLSRAVDWAVEVQYATAGGTATAGADYKVTSGTLRIPAGQTTAVVTVPLIADALDEPDETFALTLSAPVQGVIGDGSAAGTITDDDPTPDAGSTPGAGTGTSPDTGTTPADTTTTPTTTPTTTTTDGTTTSAGGAISGEATSTPTTTSNETGATSTGLTSVTVQDGTAPITVSCPSQHQAKCEGKVALKTAKAVAAGRRVLLLGKRAFSISPGRKMVVKVRLSSKARRLLRRVKKLPVIVIVTTREPSGAVHVSKRKITLKRRR